MITVHSQFDRIIQHERGSILDSLEIAGVSIQSHCRSGFCGACRTKLIEGEVEYTTEPLAYIEDDEVLPCCCKPKSMQNISIKIL
jgi:ferredoxin